MMLADQPLSKLLDAFASSDPTPGGGSASALAGALGAALLVMVCRLPKTRSGSDEDRAMLRDAAGRLDGLRERLLVQVDRDSSAYEAVVAAYRLPKATETEKALRTGVIQEALRGATGTPLQIMRDCAEALGRAATVASHGNPAAASDVGVAVELLRAGLRGARLNVEINLGAIVSTEDATTIRTEVEQLADDGERAAARLTGSGAASGPTGSG